MNSIDVAARSLYLAHWSAGELAYNAAGRIIWQVFATKGDERILARADSQAEAWAAAARQASVISAEIRFR